MSSDESKEEETPTNVLFEAEFEESSEEPPIDDWSSLILSFSDTNIKKDLQEHGLYQPGSGEICTKYITMSNSSVFRHPYYNYPAVIDPGIKTALLQPELPTIYPDDGQELYIALCKEINQCPVRIFHRRLFEKYINLRNYCVNPNGVRCMAIALRYNKFVRILDLTDNFLNDDASYHLGEMLMTNTTLHELNLSGCRIGADGAKRLLVNISVNHTLKVLNLNKNKFEDDGMEYLAKAMNVTHIHLSYNDIGSKGAYMLAEAFETHNNLVLLDLSWNKLFTQDETYNLLTTLGESEMLEELNLAWNSLSGSRIGKAIKNVMKAPTLRCLNLSNNRLNNEAITNFIGEISKAKKLLTLNLSSNPMTPSDALKILSKLKTPDVTLQNLLMDNIHINFEFLEMLDQIKQLGIDANVTYGGVVANYELEGPDSRELVLNRAEYLCKKRKKQPVDIALVVLQLLKDKNSIMAAKDFSNALKYSGAPIDEDLIDEIIHTFSGPRVAKAKTIDVKLLGDYIKRKWPDRTLPPTPPPEQLAPIPISIQRKKRK